MIGHHGADTKVFIPCFTKEAWFNAGVLRLPQMFQGTNRPEIPRLTDHHLDCP